MTRLLILDDTPEQQAAIRKAAWEAGFTDPAAVVVVKTLEEARPLLAEAFEIAVVDLHLGTDLEEAGIAFIRELHSCQRDCKIIALTLKLDNAAGVRALAWGASDFISGHWRLVHWEMLLAEKLSIYKALVEGADFPLSTVS